MLPTKDSSTLPPMRAELSAAASQSSRLASSSLVSHAFTLATSNAIVMPNCPSQGATLWLSRSSSGGTCAFSSGSSLPSTGTISSASASTITSAATSTTMTASNRGTRRAASRSTIGCSAYASTAPTTNGVSTGASSHSSKAATPARASQLRA